jgi:dipeptide/tripeptide permease
VDSRVSVYFFRYGEFFVSVSEVFASLLVSILLLCFCEFFDSVDAVFVKITMYLNFVILENKSKTESKTSKQKRRTFWYFLVIKSTRVYFIYIESIDKTH